MQPSSNSPQPQQQINRRDLLKALTASGGALLAAAFLPGKWTRPVVEAGVLPAHAQSSCSVPLEIIRVGSCGECPGGQVAYIGYTPSTLTPTQATVHYGTYGVPSVLAPDAPGFFYVYFATPGIATPNNLLQIEVTFDNDCIGYVEQVYIPDEA